MKRLINILLLVLTISLVQGQCQSYEVIKHPTNAAGWTGTYTTVYNSFGTPPEGDTATQQNQIILSIGAGTWAKLDIFYLYAQTTEADGYKNWVTPGTYDGSAYGAPTFTYMEGITGGVGHAIATNWNPTDDVSNYTQNSCSAGYYCRTNSAANACDFGQFSSAGLYIRGRLAADGYDGRCNSGGTNSGTSTDSRGMWVITRPDAAVERIYHNKVEDELSTASTGMPSQDLIVAGARTIGGGYGYYTSRQYSAFFAGSALTAAEVTAITDAIELYMDFLQKGVID
jgi:hypothetical protein